MAKHPEPAVIGVDVGTGSARAGVFGLDGRRLGRGEGKLPLWQSGAGRFQQSSVEIWRAVISAVRAARAAAGDVKIQGIGFDATCSLVVVDETGAPLPIGEEAGKNPVQDVILWMDHRAVAEAAEINASLHPVLRYVGQKISPEMQTPKLLWLKRERPESFRRAGHFFGLPDFLTFRATGSPSRSLCSTVCKWTYLGHEHRWDESYFRAIGLGVLAAEGFRRIGTEILPPGAPVGGGLARGPAAELGLPPATPVGASAIDAHAGGIGLIGAGGDQKADGAVAPERRLALITGTSSCHMAVSASPRFVPGVWGPYCGAMLPGLWLNEGGQSASGALIDHLINSHPAAALLQAEAGAGTVYERLNARLARLAAGGEPTTLAPAALTKDLHVFPDFHGNRSPRADPSLLGMLSGLTLAAGPDELARLYLATIQALAYGSRHIVEAMRGAGYAFDLVLATGGGSLNPIFLQTHADALGIPLALAREPEAVLLGAAILGAVAGGAFPDLASAIQGMSRIGRVIVPDGTTARYHAAKYAVFQRLYADQMAYRALMERAAGPG